MIEGFLFLGVTLLNWRIFGFDKFTTGFSACVSVAHFFNQFGILSL